MLGDFRRTCMAASFVLASLLASGCSSEPAAEASQDDSGVDNAAALIEAAANSTAPANALPDSPESAWQYSSERDALRNGVAHYAELISDNRVEFASPYDGGASLNMWVRNWQKSPDDLGFTVSKGQFVCGISDGCQGAINIDGKRRTLTLAEPASYDSKTLFVRNSAEMIKQLVGAKKIIVELPFYQEGDIQFEFSTPVGLVWPPKADAKSAEAGQ